MATNTEGEKMKTYFQACVDNNKLVLKTQLKRKHFIELNDNRWCVFYRDNLETQPKLLKEFFNIQDAVEYLERIKE